MVGSIFDEEDDLEFGDVSAPVSGDSGGLSSLFGGSIIPSFPSLRDIVPSSSAGPAISRGEQFVQFSSPFVVQGSGGGPAGQAVSLGIPLAFGAIALWLATRSS